MTVNEYLEKLLEDHKLSDEEREEIQTTSDEVREKLNNEFGSKIITIKYSGSIAKHTAITESKDIEKERICFANYFPQESYYREHRHDNTKQLSIR